MTRRVVVTGLGVVAPNGIGKENFWQSLIRGESGIRPITSFDASALPSRIGGEISNFSPTDFLAASKARMMGRFSQLAIAATRLALADSKASLMPSVASQAFICFGTSVSGLGSPAEAAMAGLRQKGVQGIEHWAALEYPPHAAASYIAIEFGIRGPAVSISSNCCTGLDVIQRAYIEIASGRTTFAITCSCDAPLFPLPFAGFCALGALSSRNDDPKGASRPYDRLRDGIVLSEGAGALILEDFEHAEARGAHIYATVLGFGSASEAIGMRKGDLTGAVMAAALRTAITSADILPESIDHINAHGSSLPDYDICDTNAFKGALGQHAYRIPITSIKSMIGQPISAAGTIQVIAAALSIQNSQVPPTINQEVPDPSCDLDYTPNTSRAARIRHVLINCHSFGGSVAALVLGPPC
jgi:3-oxoacyl-[acyl-carrier-protein] synthase II